MSMKVKIKKIDIQNLGNPKHKDFGTFASFLHGFSEDDFIRLEAEPIVEELVMPDLPEELEEFDEMDDMVRNYAIGQNRKAINQLIRFHRQFHNQGGGGC